MENGSGVHVIDFAVRVLDDVQAAKDKTDFTFLFAPLDFVLKLLPAGPPFLLFLH